MAEQIVYQDSYTEKTLNGTLKVYLDLNNLEECNKKLKNFIKVRTFVNNIEKVR